LLGQLELGLGAGFLRALDAPVDEVAAMVLDCVDRDPRWDHQLDERGDYYALLLLATGTDVAAVEALVADDEPAPGEADDGWALPLEVLVRMAVRGSDGAQDAVRRYLAVGARWSTALFLLEDGYEQESMIPSWRTAVRGLGEVLCRRFGSASRLRAEMEETGALWWPGGQSPLWSQWAAENPIIAAVQREEYPGPVRGERTIELEALDTAQLLAIDDSGLVRDAGYVLEHRTSSTDARLLIAAARDESLRMRGPAIEALAHQQRPEALEILAHDLRDGVRPAASRPFMRRALLALPYARTRQLAREWLESDQTSRRRAASSLLEAHAISDDVPTIREYLRREGLDSSTSDMFVVCHLVTALARHPDRGAYEELIPIFYEIPYSYGRRHVADALRATDPAFPHVLAAECLWDCEPEVRALAATHVERRNPMITARLRAIASDWAEDPDTRSVAQSRLNTT
jgi:hypothetical protein